MQLYYAITIEQTENKTTVYVTFIEQSLWDSRPLNIKDFNASLSDRSSIEAYVNSLNLDFLTAIGDMKGIYEYKLKENSIIDNSLFFKHGLFHYC